MTTFWFILTYLVGTYIGAEIGFKLGQRFMYNRIVVGMQENMKALMLDWRKGDGKQDGSADAGGNDPPKAD